MLVPPQAGRGTRVAPAPGVFPCLTVVMLLAAGADADARQARRELEACAARIEALKAQPEAGELARRELDRLLVRAQELAHALERAGQPVPTLPAAPSPEELRERADAARDEADRLAAEIALLDVKLNDARRQVHADADASFARATLGAAAPSSQLERVRALTIQRAALARRRALAEAAAQRYEADARAAEADR